MFLRLFDTQAKLEILSFRCALKAREEPAYLWEWQGYGFERPWQVWALAFAALDRCRRSKEQQVPHRACGPVRNDKLCGAVRSVYGLPVAALPIQISRHAD